jgi:D-3-phosphoglycerate dehydrogenase
MAFNRNNVVKILLVDTIHPAFSSTLADAGFTLVEGYDWSREKIIKHIDEFTGIAIRSRIKLDADFLQNSTSLKFIARAGAGMENIDVDYAVSKKITVKKYFLHKCSGGKP